MKNFSLPLLVITGLGTVIHAFSGGARAPWMAGTWPGHDDTRHERDPRFGTSSGIFNLR